jgi:hypothetical protein
MRLHSIGIGIAALVLPSTAMHAQRLGALAPGTRLHVMMQNGEVAPNCSSRSLVLAGGFTMNSRRFLTLRC